MIYIVGLGNPGSHYEGTRHNIGAAVLEAYIAERSFTPPVHEKKLQARIARGNEGVESVYAVFPQTYMNHSGQAVAAVQKYFGTGTVVAIYDDVDLPVGTFKVAARGGAGGHNGVKSLIQHVGEDFVRVRIGIAPVRFWTGRAIRPAGDQLARFVLQSFGSRERAAIAALQPKLIDALSCVVREGVDAAMNRYNG